MLGLQTAGPFRSILPSKNDHFYNNKNSSSSRWHYKGKLSKPTKKAQIRKLGTTPIKKRGEPR